MSFQTCRCTEHGTTCPNLKMRPDDLLMHHEYRPSSSYHALPADRRNKTLECWLATLNASSPTMSHALEQIKAARIGVICQGASSAPHFLLARLQGHSFQFIFQLVFLPYTLQLLSICVLPTAFKTFCSNKLGILTGTSWHFSNISSDISALWSHESTSLDVNKANGMLTRNTKRIFCNNVTCFGTKKCCSNRSHLQRVLQVLVTSCLQGCSFQLFPHTLYSFFLTVSCWLLSRHSVRTSWEF